MRLSRRQMATRSMGTLAAGGFITHLLGGVLVGIGLSGIGPVSTGVAAPPPASSGDEPVTATDDSQSTDTGNLKVATLAGGCFWCTEAVFEQIDGVDDVVSGYIGGHVENPTYEQVCGKQTGHAEAVEVYYDPSKVAYEKLLEIFFKTHDPTTPNQQGNDVGPQYRSVVFYHDEDQKQAAQNYIAKLTKEREFRAPIVTELQKATTFYAAEEYHQDYFRKNPFAGYCQAVVSQKVRKTKVLFKDELKPKK